MGLDLVLLKHNFGPGTRLCSRLVDPGFSCINKGACDSVSLLRIVVIGSGRSELYLSLHEAKSKLGMSLVSDGYGKPVSFGSACIPTPRFPKGETHLPGAGRAAAPSPILDKLFFQKKWWNPENRHFITSLFDQKGKKWSRIIGLLKIAPTLFEKSKSKIPNFLN